MGVVTSNGRASMPSRSAAVEGLARARAAEATQKNASQPTVIRATRRMTVGWLAFFCVASAALALASPSTAADLEGMLALPFEVTTPMVVGLIVVGGAGLLAAQYWVTGFAARLIRRGTGALAQDGRPT